MQFAPQQDEALKAVSKWLKEGKTPVFRLFGYAGTGKTTLAKHFAEHVDGDVLFAAFTGKAALVMRSKGCADASTIHSMIYRPKRPAEDEEETEETFSFALNRHADIAKADLVDRHHVVLVDNRQHAVQRLQS